MKYRVILERTSEDGTVQRGILWDEVEFLTPPMVGDLVRLHSDEAGRVVQEVIITAREHYFSEGKPAVCFLIARPRR